MLAAGSPSSALVKRLKYIGQCLEELSSLGVIGTDDTNPASNFDNAASSSRSTSTTAERPGVLGAEGSGFRAKVSAESVRAGRKFQQQFLQELPSLMVLPGEALRHHLSWFGFSCQAMTSAGFTTE